MAVDEILESPPFPSPVKKYHRRAYPAISPSRPELSTKGKNVVITGAGGGIGSAIAHAYATSGAAVIGLIGRTVSSLEATRKSVQDAFPKSVVHVIAGDMTQELSIKAALKQFASKTESGRIDILVANAGYYPHTSTIDASDSEEWWRGFEINVLGNYNLLRAFTPLAAEKDAVVINVSTAVVHLTFPGSASYQASKLAALKVFDNFGLEHPEVRVVNFHPGVIETNMYRKAKEGNPDFEMPADDADLPGAFAVWLASPEASFVNGKLIWAHWDVDELKSMADEIGGPTDPKFTMNLTGWNQ